MKFRLIVVGAVAGVATSIITGLFSPQSYAFVLIEAIAVGTIVGLIARFTYKPNPPRRD